MRFLIMPRSAWPLILLILTATADRARADDAFFETKIRPLFAAHCFECHGPAKQSGDLRLDSADHLAQGGASGEPTVVAKDPEKSFLLRAVRHRDGAPAMPPKRKLKDSEVADLTRWVQDGAVFPKGNFQVAKTPETKHWAFQPVVEPKLPAVKDEKGVRNPIDRFVLAKLESKGMKPAPAADRRTLIRRVTFDLIGLPPTPGEVEAFVRDVSPDAFAKVVDRLLASPHYGERWGRHWLDLARYADSNGMDENLVYGNAWRYRDYVIRAFNEDKPFDRFVREQIAGDLVPVPQGRQPIEATGFLVVGPKMLAEDDPVKMEMDVIDEQIDTIGRAFLGMSLGCARCHDHKIDPASITDYYAMAGIFKSTKTMDTFTVVAKWHERALRTKEEEAAAQAAIEAIAQLKKRIADAEARLKLALPEVERESLRRETAVLRVDLTKRESQKPLLAEAMAASERKGTNLKIHLRGSHLTLGKEAQRGFPKVIGPLTEFPKDAPQSGRLELADWIARPDHPLTSRVTVNRIWKWHFGEGIVRTPDDFGRIGEPPTHPELLDWLAVQFARSGWSIKAMHRLILSSAVYQMSVIQDEALERTDPENRLLWKFHRQRLEAEAIRDALLAVSGTLDPAMGGSLLDGTNRSYVKGYPNGRYEKYDFPRRSVYLPVLRSMLYDVFQAFDFADPSVGNGRRVSTTVAPQALFMMNGKLMTESSRRLAERLRATPGTDAERVQMAFLRLYSRPATAAETSKILDHIARAADSAKDRPEGERHAFAWQSACRVLLSANEFVYVE
ncbi:MAG: PSD1 and planctomycete cytochrome C domain-containing protein [Gemmataceae bacterium]|nr:PSD1 and planctomycete cytochrome C domain-containing protein [Gemmataceae bacterium]